MFAEFGEDAPSKAEEEKNLRLGAISLLLVLDTLEDVAPVCWAQDYREY